MHKKWTFSIFVAMLSLIIASSAFAATAVTGTWNVSVNMVKYNIPTKAPSYSATKTYLMKITSQKDNRFYGTLNGLPMVGTLSGSSVLMSAYGDSGVIVVQGTLSVTATQKIINFSFTEFVPNDVISVGTGRATK